MAAGQAAASGCSVLLLEKMGQCGLKLCITGKGKCNITNTRSWKDFADHIYPQADFLRPAFWSFSNEAVLVFFHSIGIDTVKERGNRIFPACQSAPLVRDALVKWAKERGVHILTRVKVLALESTGKQITSVQYQKQEKEVSVICKAVVLATGGYSFPLTGSDGDGHRLAEQLGHKIIPCFPALTGLMPKGYDKRLQGITLNNIGLDLRIDGALVREEFGEIIFTDQGIEGSLGYRLSRQVVMAMCKKQEAVLVLNLKAAIPREQLEARVHRDAQRLGMEPVAIFLRRYMPGELVPPFMGYIGLWPGDFVKELSADQIQKLLRGLQHWELPIERYGGYDRAIVTGGGISLQYIRKKDMRSQIMENLFFAGELIDLDGDTGGYNLQIAFSTGALAGKNAADLSQAKA
ncbi:MAG: aminoacetone oxidase family FAD-binding enzyme [Bacteroidales bacterium]|nr:aminoacetone oxidase family FAD-binding enzyme [Bacteroidales bacterium]MCL2738822.1 aminoacetone oxidase family FAD-binding enzyme [Bacteroidales bacterium]